MNLLINAFAICGLIIFFAISVLALFALRMIVRKFNQSCLTEIYAEQFRLVINNQVFIAPTPLGEFMYQLKAGQQVIAAVQLQDKFGNTAPVQTPVWSSSDDTVIVVSPSTDGLSAIFKSTGKIGSSQISFSCDGDMGEGVVPLQAVDTISVAAGNATALSFVFGNAEDPPSATIPEPTPVQVETAPQPAPALEPAPTPEEPAPTPAQ